MYHTPIESSTLISGQELDIAETCLLMETKGVYSAQNGGVFGLIVFDNDNRIIFDIPIKYYTEGDIIYKCFSGQAKEIHLETNFVEKRDCWYTWLIYKWSYHCNYNGWIGSLKVLVNDVQKQILCKDCGGTDLDGEYGVYIDRNAFNTYKFKTIISHYTTCDNSCSFTIS